METVKYIIWIVAILAFIASGWFVRVLVGLAGIVQDANENFWIHLPAQFQVLILGLIAVLIFGYIKVFTKG